MISISARLKKSFDRIIAVHLPVNNCIISNANCHKNRRKKVVAEKLSWWWAFWSQDYFSGQRFGPDCDSS